MKQILISLFALCSLLPAWASDHLRFTARQDGSSVMIEKINVVGDAHVKDNSAAPDYIKYSFDRTNWINAVNVEIPLSNGQTVYFDKGNGSFTPSTSSYYHFVMTGKIEAGGDFSIHRPNGWEVYQGYTPEKYAYYKLFSGCTSLIKAPRLHIKTNDYCYYETFEGCINLEEAPTGLDTQNDGILSEGCFRGMFKGCTKLTKPLYIPYNNGRKVNQTIPTRCFQNMYEGCTSLENAPSVSATTVGAYSCMEMFKDCISLKRAPAVSATTLATSCYEGMYEGCTELDAGPELPATTLQSNCYRNMFKGCTSLAYIKVAFTNWGATDATSETENVDALTHRVYPYTYHWVENAPSSGVFIAPTTLAKEYNSSQIPKGWGDVDTNSALTDYFYFKTIDNGAGFTISQSSGTWVAPFYISTDNGKTWNEINQYYNSISTGQTVLFKSRLDNGTLNSKEKYYTLNFSPSGSKYEFGGNIMSLIDPTCTQTDVPEYAFYRLFKDCKALKNAPELPFTSIAQGCYEEMFAGCTGLTEAPALPASILEDDCYKNMFNGCTNLKEMNVSFTDWGTGNNQYTSGWVTGVASSGIFHCPAELLGSSPIFGSSNVPKDTSNPWVTMQDYLCFTAEENSTQIWLRKNGSPVDVHLEYYDPNYEEWKTYNNITININRGQKVYFRATSSNDGFSESEHDYYYFWFNKGVAVSGNIMSLLDKTCLRKDVPNYAFYRLFSESPKVVDASKLSLPATTLGEYCYSYMFDGCGGLKATPKILPAPELKSHCYSYMFNDCWQITTGPELPGTMLDNYCYKGLFYGCWALAKAPELSAPQLKEGCYQYMFYDCRTLKDAPRLPAEKLKENCYAHMFESCTALNHIIVAFNEWPSAENNNQNALTDWAKGVNLVGIFDCPYLLLPSTLNDNDFQNNKIPARDASNNVHRWVVNHDYLCFKAIVGGSLILKKFGAIADANLEYSTDGITWVSMIDKQMQNTETNESPYEIPIATGDRLYIRNTSTDNNKFSTSSSKYYRFTLYGSYEVEGQISSLLNSHCIVNEIPKYTFYRLFFECAGIRTAPELPKVSASEGCYAYMFRGCTELKKAPKLPATTLAKRCYYHMFYGCKNMLEAPELPALTLAEECYRAMFYGCKALTAAPVLPATELVNGCYNQMFYGCNHIKEISVMFTDWKWSETRATENWVKGVPNKGTFNCPDNLPIDYLGWSLAPKDSLHHWKTNGIVLERPLTYFSNPEEGGSISGTPAGVYSSGTAINLTATPNEGYRFLNWTYGDRVESTSANFSTRMPASAYELYANFVDNAIAIFPGLKGELPEDWTFTEGINFERCTDADRVMKGRWVMNIGEEKETVTFHVPYYAQVNKIVFVGTSATTTAGSITIANATPINGTSLQGINGETNQFSMLTFKPSSDKEYFEDQDVVITLDKGLYGILKFYGKEDDHCKMPVLKPDYENDVLNIIAEEGVKYYWSKSPEVTKDNGTLYNGPISFNLINKGDDTPVPVYAIAYKENNDQAKSLVANKTIYFYHPKNYGYCLVSDEESLNKAIDYANHVSSEDYSAKVFIPVGTYDLSLVENTTISDYVSLIGESETQTELVGDLTINGNEVYIQDMKVTNIKDRGFDNTFCHVNATGISLSDYEQAKVQAIYHNGSTISIASDAESHKYLIEIKDAEDNVIEYCITNCESFFLYSNLDGKIVTARAANDRGGFGNIGMDKIPPTTNGTLLTTVKLNSAGYATFSHAQDVQIIGASAYTGYMRRDASGEKVVTLSLISNETATKVDIIPAGTGVLLFGLPGANVDIYSYSEGTSDIDVSKNEFIANLTGLHGDGYSWESDLHKSGKTIYVLANSGNTFKKLKEETGKLAANKAYFVIDDNTGSSLTDASAASLRTAFNQWSFDVTYYWEESVNKRQEESTGIENIEMRFNDDEGIYTYTLSGFRANSKRGLLIKNGKVVLLK